MKLAFRKIRLVAHLLHGMWTVATRFPHACAGERLALNRAWSLKMLRLCGMRLVVHNDDVQLDAGVLVVSNHVSWIDIYVINARVRRRSSRRPRSASGRWSAGSHSNWARVSGGGGGGLGFRGAAWVAGGQGAGCGDRQHRDAGRRSASRRRGYADRWWRPDAHELGQQP